MKVKEFLEISDMLRNYFSVDSEIINIDLENNTISVKTENDKIRKIYIVHTANYEVIFYEEFLEHTGMYQNQP